MPFTVVRFNLVDPRATPESLSERYRAALAMAAYADEHGVDTVQTEEHHGVENNWLPSPSPSRARSSGRRAGSPSRSRRSSDHCTIRCGSPRTSRSSTC